MQINRLQSNKRLKSLSTFVGRSLAVVLAAVLLTPVTALHAHTPYGQWDSFRTRHLQVLTSRSDLVGDAVADKWVAVLTEHLPKSKAVVSRARTVMGIASLLKTDQAKLAVLSYEHAQSMIHGSDEFEEFGPISLQVLLDNGEYLLVTRDDLPTKHGFLVVDALLEKADELQLSVPEVGPFGMVVHEGAREVVLEH